MHCKSINWLFLCDREHWLLRFNLNYISTSHESSPLLILVSVYIWQFRNYMPILHCWSDFVKLIYYCYSHMDNWLMLTHLWCSVLFITISANLKMWKAPMKMCYFQWSCHLLYKSHQIISQFHLIINPRSIHRRCFVRKGFLRNFANTIFTEHIWTTASVIWRTSND